VRLHTPEAMNRAHSDVIGLPGREALTEVRILLLGASNLVIRLGAQRAPTNIALARDLKLIFDTMRP
jgi:hypothetical protein